MVVNSIFDVAEFQTRKKAILKKSGKKKLTGAEGKKIRAQAKKPLSKYKNLKVVELTKNGKSTGRFFLRGQLKTAGGGMRWRILGKADREAAIEEYGSTTQKVKAKPAKKKAAAKKSPAKRGRRATSPVNARTKAKLLSMTTVQLKAEAKKTRPTGKRSALNKAQLVDLILTGKPGRSGRKSPRGKSPKKARRATSPAKKSPARKTSAKKSPARKTSAKKSPARKTSAKKSPKQTLLKGLDRAGLLKVAKAYNMQGVSSKTTVVALRKKVGTKTVKEIKKAM